MDYEVSSKSGEYAPSGKSQEVLSPYETIDHDTLIGTFYKTKGSPEIGRELATRLFDHAGFTDDPITTPLIGSDGNQVYKDGQPLVLADYVNFAASHHFKAVPSILGFLRMDPDGSDYKDMRDTMLKRLKPSED